MRLHRHDELVEAMARALFENTAIPSDGPYDQLDEYWRIEYLSDATAALDALLEAAVRLEVAEVYNFPHKPCINFLLEERT